MERALEKIELTPKVALQLAQIWSVSLADTPPLAADAAYVFSETADNQEEPLSMAAKLYADGRIPLVYCSGSGPSQPDPNAPESFPGFDAWKDRLIGHGVAAEAISGIPMPIHLWHTGVEAYEFVLRAQRENWRTVFVVAPSLHLPRCFANTISIAIREKVDLDIFAINSAMPPGSWHQSVLHSWGRVTAPRIQLIDGEIDRMLRRYGNEYDLVDFKDILDYLARRDGFM